nr:EOG090X069C [Macrothrix elegans]
MLTRPPYSEAKKKKLKKKENSHERQVRIDTNSEPKKVNRKGYTDDTTVQQCSRVTESSFLMTTEHPPSASISNMKTLYYGMLLKTTHSLKSTLPLTNVVVEKFSQCDSNLFLGKICFDYAADLSRDACLSPCSIVLALIYLERLCQNNPNFISSVPSSKLFLISVLVATKFLSDDGEEDEVINSEWANSAKLDLKELNELERQFLQAIDWALYVDDEEFSEALAKIECHVARQESLKRGWLTYTDLTVLAHQKLLKDTLDLVHSLVLNVSIACMTAYLASLFTLYCGMMSSAIVASSFTWNLRSGHATPLVLSPPSTNRSDPSTLRHDLNSEINQDEIESIILDPEGLFTTSTFLSEIASAVNDKTVHHEINPSHLGIIQEKLPDENVTLPTIDIDIKPFHRIYPESIGLLSPESFQFLCTVKA